MNRNFYPLVYFLLKYLHTHKLIVNKYLFIYNFTITLHSRALIDSQKCLAQSWMCICQSGSLIGSLIGRNIRTILHNFMPCS